MHIFEALIKDHEKIKDLLDELLSLEENDHESRADLVKDIRDELIPHARAEESVFYNSLRALDVNVEKVMHGYREHVEAEALLRALQVEDKTKLSWKSTAKKLKEALEHHIREEEGEIFAGARQVLTVKEARTLGNLFEKLKPQIKDEGLMKTSLEMVMNLMPVRLSDRIKNLKSA